MTTLAACAHDLAPLARATTIDIQSAGISEFGREAFAASENSQPTVLSCAPVRHVVALTLTDLRYATGKRSPFGCAFPETFLNYVARFDPASRLVSFAHCSLLSVSQ
jgi:hypothetical protein